MIATVFIYAVFALIIIVDILLGVFKKKYITDIFREWYKSRHIVPFAVGVVFIGHFQTLVMVSCIPLFITLSVIYLAWFIIMNVTKINTTRRLHDLFNRLFFIPMLIGTVIGSFWRT